MASAPADLPPRLCAEMRALAMQLPALQQGRDDDAYRAAGRDPNEPLVGFGPPGAPVCVLGRDPGAEELRLGQPFVGAAGRLLREGLCAWAGMPAPTPPDLLQVGRSLYWLNLVPYKPRGNEVWPAAVRHAFRPLVLQALRDHWQGRTVLALGEHASAWFGAGQPTAVREQLRARWARVLDPRAPPLELALPGAVPGRRIALHPLPHPSPRNVLGRRAFPALLQAALARAQALPQSGG